MSKHMKSKKCKMCGTEFYSENAKKMFCSNDCVSAHKSSPEYKANLVAKQKATFLKKYGVDNPAKSDIVKKKTADTVLKRYGAISPTLNPTVRKKQIDTCRERYGADTPLQSESVLHTIHESILKNLGVDTPFASAEIQYRANNTKLQRYDDAFYNNDDKRKRTCMEKYGVDNPSTLESVKAVARATCQKKYGASSSIGNPTIKAKAIDTIRKNYGVDNPMQSAEIRDRVIQTNRDRYGVDYAIQSESSQLKRMQTCRETYYNELQSRFSDIVELQFSKEEYSGGIDWSKKYPFKCVKCNTCFDDTVVSSHIPRCPKCYPLHAGTSKIEGQLHDLIKQLYTGPIIHRDKSVIGKLEVDFYLPERNLAIELDGLYWHSEISGKKNKRYHINKTEKCEVAGVHLIHIFEDEFISKRQIVERKLAHLLGNDASEKIYARKCTISEISAIESNGFLTRYHMQGKDKSSVRFGAYFNGELVSVMTFGPRRRALGFHKSGQNQYEMYRFCVKGNVVGILGKLLNAFVLKYNPTNIITYADRRYSSILKLGYETVGFKVVKTTEPNYWYTKDYTNREYRYKYRKSEIKKLLPIFDANSTEWQNMKNNGFDRIWDCGSVRLEWTNSVAA
jgi:very-short-patch-repair endonuclease